jgi:hypothetical protein
MLRKAFLLLTEMNPAKATEFLECYEGVETYHNYLSESEAKTIVKGFVNYDKSMGGKWSPDDLFEKVEELGGIVEEKPYYNKWALYAVMNMEHSDHGKVIGKWSEGDPDRYAEACYEFAVSQLTDADRERFVRGYFGLE